MLATSSVRFRDSTEKYQSEFSDAITGAAIEYNQRDLFVSSLTANCSIILWRSCRVLMNTVNSDNILWLSFRNNVESLDAGWISWIDAVRCMHRPLWPATSRRLIFNRGYSDCETMQVKTTPLLDKIILNTSLDFMRIGNRSAISVWSWHDSVEHHRLF